MVYPLYQVDAFTSAVFGGNPACVVPLKEWLPDEVLLKITQENAVAETAFFIPQAEGFQLRWFTPEIEMDLCGHATLATAHVLQAHLGHTAFPVQFHTASGLLSVDYQNGFYHLDFPSRMPVPAELPAEIWQALSIPPKAILKARDYVLVYESESDIRNMEVDRQVLDQINLDPGGVVVTAPGDRVDFVSRFFTPQASILEDPVTGSAHCSLIPYWAGQLGKSTLSALQLSDRVGSLQCEDREDRVQISGQAVTYLKGELYLP
ncbi:MAG: PhzF family phenazine biosynthesis protein [Bacteroidota bacterium]